MALAMAAAMAALAFKSAAMAMATVPAGVIIRATIHIISGDMPPLITAGAITTLIITPPITGEPITIAAITETVTLAILIGVIVVITAAIIEPGLADRRAAPRLLSVDGGG